MHMQTNLYIKTKEVNYTFETIIRRVPLVLCFTTPILVTNIGINDAVSSLASECLIFNVFRVVYLSLHLVAIC